MSWITPITDRTQADVDRLLYLQAKANEYGYISLTTEERAEWKVAHKGALNYNDLNRIEGNISELSSVLNAYAYTQSVAERSQWTAADFPTYSELKRIRDNLQVLISAYYSLDTLPPTDAEMLRPNHDVINRVEKITADIKHIIELMEARFNYCGATTCGAENL